MDLDIYDYKFMMTRIPLRNRYEPTYVELIQYYLLKKVNGKLLPYNIISKYQIYSGQGNV
ncbi:hypothetical protein Gogos_016689 [Gossypium gossypioides]|uniref:NAC domain-containing protein n=1 Tax=Gossypium gossypioides TaxID=34282 RepID=A0A7J9B8I4_GOSGO|nr:hypothetical protein [Gossypium gossypioides]